MTDVETEAEEERAAGESRVSRLLGEADLRNTWQIVAGAVFIPLGLVIILLAWYGAAHANHVQQQIPYMVSGGFIGLGLMLVGGLMFWAHWLYRLYDQANLNHEELLEAIRSNGHVPVAAAESASGPGFVATPTGTNYHRPDCAVVARADRRKLRRVSADEAASMQPCRICEPA